MARSVYNLCILSQSMQSVQQTVHSISIHKHTFIFISWASCVLVLYTHMIFEPIYKTALEHVSYIIVVAEYNVV